MPEDVGPPVPEKAWNSQDLGSHYRAHRNRSRFAANKPLRFSNVRCTLVPVYHQKIRLLLIVLLERVQMGVRIEKRLLKVMKALAEYRDATLVHLIE